MVDVMQGARASPAPQTVYTGASSGVCPPSPVPLLSCNLECSAQFSSGLPLVRGRSLGARAFWDLLLLYLGVPTGVSFTDASKMA